MAVDRSFAWLGRFPLAVDLADTVRVVGQDEVELLTDDRTLDAWVEIEQRRFPVAGEARGHLAEVIKLRTAVRELLYASADGLPLPESARETINDASLRSPVAVTVDAGGNAQHREFAGASFERFAGAVGRSAIYVATGSDRERLAVCRGPGCGMLFLHGDSRQRWCSPACGNRARVARYAARHR
jgi:predicted RNA-binding Zn ribbon-like protein